MCAHEELKSEWTCGNAFYNILTWKKARRGEGSPHQCWKKSHGIYLLINHFYYYSFQNYSFENFAKAPFSLRYGPSPSFIIYDLCFLSLSYDYNFFKFLFFFMYLFKLALCDLRQIILLCRLSYFVYYYKQFFWKYKYILL